VKLCIFGGSFNPPHNGHLEAARFAAEMLAPDLLLWVPAGDPPHKTLAPGSPDAAHRLEMSRLAVAGLPRCQVCDMEINGETRYTADTAKALTARYKPGELWLCVGGDMLLELDRWHDAETIFRLCHIAALARREAEKDALRQKAEGLRKKSGAQIKLFQNPIHEISSTEIRALLKQNKGEEWIPAPVYRYIQKEKLY